MKPLLSLLKSIPDRVGWAWINSTPNWPWFVAMVVLLVIDTVTLYYVIRGWK